MMEPNRLLGDEITYELLIRGYAISGTVAQKRSIFAEVLRSEREGERTMPSCTNLDPNVELVTCECKLEDLREDIENFRTGNRENEYKRISSRLTHVLSRLGRIREPGDVDKRDGLVVIGKGLVRRLEEVFELANCASKEVRAQAERSLMDAPVPLLPEVIHDSSQVTPDEQPELLGIVEGIGRLGTRDRQDIITSISDVAGGAHAAKSSSRVSNLRNLFENKSSAEPDEHTRYSVPIIQPDHSRFSQSRLPYPFHTQSTFTHQEVIPSPRSDSSLQVQHSTIIPPLNPPIPATQVATASGAIYPITTPSPSRCDDIFRWPVKFDGVSSVTGFLERIEELRVSRGVAKERLLQSASELFTKDALLWYRMNQFSSWDQLVLRLKEDFQPHDYEFALWEEIRHRTQGTTEKVISFVAVMENLFRKLSVLPPESSRVELIRRNFLPYIQRQLSVLCIDSLSTLIKTAKMIEATEVRAQGFNPPPSNPRRLVEPELGYRRTGGNPTVNISAVEAVQQITTNRRVDSAEGEVALVARDRSTLKCWNCDKAGHGFRKCPVRRKKLFVIGVVSRKFLRIHVQNVKKLHGRHPVGRTDASAVTTPVIKDKTLAILDFVIAHAKNDLRPYLDVEIYGKRIPALLDSGCTRTTMGSLGWDIFRSVCKLDVSDVKGCTVANGMNCKVIGSIIVPITLENKTKVFEIIVVPSVPHRLILGVDFWLAMGIVPDLHSGLWTFRDETSALESNISSILTTEHISVDQKKELESLIEDTFAKMGTKIGCTNMVEHVIQTNSPPIKQRHYPLSPAMQRYVNEEIEKMLQEDIIEPSTSPWASPIVLVQKPSGGYRFCVNYKKLNEVTVRDAYPLPFVSATLDKLRDAKFLTTLDIKSAYWQIPVAEASRPLTAFVCQKGLYQFKRLPFGLHNAGATWQRFIDRVLGSSLENYVFVYLDDVIVCTPTFEQHIGVLREVLSKLMSAGLTLNREKCNFCKKELKYLGYVVNANGLLVDPEKVAAIVQISPPKNVTEVRRFVGLSAWYRRFVKDFATVMAPLTALLRKNQRFVWSEECQKSFETVKEYLISAPILSCPNYDLPFTIQTDASDYGLGAVLLQQQDDGVKVICYLSRSLTKQERKYTVTEKECLAVLFAIEKLRPYVEGTHFTVVTDHYSLKWLFSIKDPVGRIARWALRIQQYDFEIIHRKGRDNVVADALSRSVPIVSVIDSSTIFHGCKDKWYNNMVERITNQPDRFPLWRTEGNNLYRYVKLKYSELSDGRSEWLLVVPKDKRRQMIEKFHDPPTMGHLGISKTLARIAAHHYWPKMSSDVANYVRHCNVCLQTKPEQKSPIGHMLSKSLSTTRPWQVISMDLVGPLPRTPSGYCYILSVCDYFSKYTLLFPLRNSNAPNVVRHLEEQVILRYGAPDKIVVDNGPQFRSKVFKDKAAEYGIRLSYTALYHAAPNIVERVHRVVKTMLTSYTSHHHPSWEKYLAKVGWAIRSAKHDVTGLTPNFVFFGRELRVEGNRTSVQANEEPLGAHTRATVLQQIFQDVRQRLEKAYETGRKYYNLRRRDDKFILGQRVWRRNNILSDKAKQITAKLSPKFSGPYTIRKILSPWTYELEDVDGSNVGIWHAKDLKAHPPEEQNASNSD